MRTSAPILIASDLIRNGEGYPNGHPLGRVNRITLTMDLMEAMGWLSPRNYRHVKPASVRELSPPHDLSYLATLARLDDSYGITKEVSQRYHLGGDSGTTPIYKGLYAWHACAGAAGLLAADLLSSGEASHVFNLIGGGHHAYPNHASGFCYINDIAVTIHRLKSNGMDRIFYLDLDAHHGDAVQDIFENDHNVFTLSLHGHFIKDPEKGNEKDKGQSHANIVLDQKTTGADLGMIVEKIVHPLIKRHRPDVLIIQAGADILADDPMSCLRFGNYEMTEMIAGLMTTSSRVLLLGGGGYNPLAAARYWTALWGKMNGFPFPRVLSHSAKSVLLRHLTWHPPRIHTAKEDHFAAHYNGHVPRHLYTSLLDPKKDEGESTTAQAARRIAFVETMRQRHLA